MKRTYSLLAAVLAAFALPVLAQSVVVPAKDPVATPGVDKRQASQQQRIDQGVKSGELTAKEAARLEKGQERVQKMEDKAKADGVVTKQERARLQQAENVQSRQIAKERYDRQRDRNHDGRKDRPARNK
ncbi:MAG: hypothetical protein OEL20_09380 [Sulfuritalea sp.]|nr:hypothetical protein [Sulfuritalea sp.]